MAAGVTAAGQHRRVAQAWACLAARFRQAGCSLVGTVGVSEAYRDHHPVATGFGCVSLRCVAPGWPVRRGKIGAEQDAVPAGVPGRWLPRPARSERGLGPGISGLRVSGFRVSPLSGILVEIRGISPTAAPAHPHALAHPQFARLASSVP
jgi:hypothetical protein